MRVDTLETDLRCELAARIHAVEAELRIAAPGAAHMVARVQAVEGDLKSLRTHACKHEEDLTARVAALEGGFQSARRNPDQPVAASNVGAGSCLVQPQGGDSSPASTLSSFALQAERSRRCPSKEGGFAGSGGRLSVGSASLSVPRSRSHSVQEGARQPGSGEAERGVDPAFPAVRPVQATPAGKTPIVQPTPPTVVTPAPAPGLGTTMNQELKESLVCLVSKVHTALVGAKSHGDVEPDALYGAETTDGEEAPGEAPETRQVFKMALQELMEENRALQQETSQIEDGYESGSSAQFNPPGGPVGMQPPTPRRIPVASLQGREGSPPPQVSGGLSRPPPVALGQAGSKRLSGGHLYGGSASLPPGYGGGNLGGPPQVGGSVIASIGGGPVPRAAPFGVQPLPPQQQQGMQRPSTSPAGLTPTQGQMLPRTFSPSRSPPGAAGGPQQHLSCYLGNPNAVAAAGQARGRRLV